MTLTVTNKLRPHRESLSLLSPGVSLFVCAYVHFGNNPHVIVFLNYSSHFAKTADVLIFRKLEAGKY